jgi:tight adherence protein C
VILVLVLGILLIVACAYLLAEMATLPARQRRASLERATAYSEGEAGVSSILGDEPGQRLQGIGSLLEQLVPSSMLDSIDQRLGEAGLTWKITPAGFMVAKVGACAAGLVVGALIAAQGNNTLFGILLAAACGAFLFVLPDRLLASRARSRKERLSGDLPDALDLLAICVEAGMSLDAALGQLVEHMDGPLADEFAQTLGEMRIGESRQDALKRLGERSNVPSMSALVRAIIQSDQQGVPLGRVLRIQARNVRIHRQQEAEERAAKMPVKMLLPTALFIFPVIFFVVVGPAFIELSHIF